MSELLPATFEEVNGLAKAFIQSGYFSDTKQLAQAIVKIQAGKELALPPVFSMQNINLIRNRLTSSANTLALLVKRSGKYNYRIKEHTEAVCSISFLEAQDGKWVEVGESTFTIEDAKRADLVKPDSGWVKYPRAMLFSRAISQGARIYCPDAIGGIYTDEEIRSIPTERVEGGEQVEAAGTQQDPATKPDSWEAEASAELDEKGKTQNKIDLGWLKEQLTTLQAHDATTWGNSKVVAYLNSVTGAKAKSVAKAVAALNTNQAEAFVQKVQRVVEECN